MLRMLPECISIYLNSDMRYEPLIFCTYPPNSQYIYVRKDVSFHYYFSKAKGVHDRLLGKYCTRVFFNVLTIKNLKDWFERT